MNFCELCGDTKELTYEGFVDGEHRFVGECSCEALPFSHIDHEFIVQNAIVILAEERLALAAKKPREFIVDMSVS